MVFIRDVLKNTDDFSTFECTLLYDREWDDPLRGAITPDGDFFQLHESSTDLNQALQWMERQEITQQVGEELEMMTAVMDEFYQRGEFAKAK